MTKFLRKIEPYLGRKMSTGWAIFAYSAMTFFVLGLIIGEYAA